MKQLDDYCKKECICTPIKADGLQEELFGKFEKDDKCPFHGDNPPKPDPKCPVHNKEKE